MAQLAPEIGKTGVLGSLHEKRKYLRAALFRYHGRAGVNLHYAAGGGNSALREDYHFAAFFNFVYNRFDRHGVCRIHRIMFYKTQKELYPKPFGYGSVYDKSDVIGQKSRHYKRVQEGIVIGYYQSSAAGGAVIFHTFDFYRIKRI